MSSNQDNANFESPLTNQTSLPSSIQQPDYDALRPVEENSWATSSLWWLFPIEGIGLRDATCTEPLFGDATLLSSKSVTAELKSAGWDRLGRDLLTQAGLISDHDHQVHYIAVRRRAAKPQFPQSFGETKALARAREIAALLSLVMLLERDDGLTCGLTYDLPNSQFSLLGFDREAPRCVQGTKTLDLFPARPHCFLMCMSDLKKLLSKPLFVTAFRAITNDKESNLTSLFRKKFVRSMVRLGYAVHCDAGGQLLGAYTALEMLFDGVQDTLSKRIQVLVGDNGGSDWKNITNLRNNYVHRGAEVSNQDAKKSLYLATYTAFAYAELVSRLSPKTSTDSEIAKLLDLRWLIKFGDPECLYKYAVDEQLFVCNFGNFVSRQQDAISSNDCWSGFTMHCIPEPEE